jgi:hypothetical protein
MNYCGQLGTAPQEVIKAHAAVTSTKGRHYTCLNNDRDVPWGPCRASAGDGDGARLMDLGGGRGSV